MTDRKAPATEATTGRRHRAHPEPVATCQACRSYVEDRMGLHVPYDSDWWQDPKRWSEAVREHVKGGKAHLQEVYRRLDNTDDGTTLIAWYGQLRAEEYPHEEALEMTIEHGRLRTRPWWAIRFPEEVATENGS